MEMNLNLAGKIFFVTGAGSGIGAAATDILVGAGAKVAACDRDQAALEKVKATHGDKVLLAPADISQKVQIDSAVQSCIEKFGRLDSVLHFAAILDSHQIDDLTPEIWNNVMNVNLLGTFLVAQAAVPQMRKQNGGRIVFTASDSARMGSLVSGPAYAASKGGVIALTHTLALGLGKSNITVNAVCPGLTMTGMSDGWTDDFVGGIAKRTPLGRLAQPDEVARVAIFLGSDAANFVTGEVMEVNGGIHFD